TASVGAIRHPRGLLHYGSRYSSVKNLPPTFSRTTLPGRTVSHSPLYFRCVAKRSAAGRIGVALRVLPGPVRNPPGKPAKYVGTPRTLPRDGLATDSACRQAPARRCGSACPDGTSLASRDCASRGASGVPSMTVRTCPDAPGAQLPEAFWLVVYAVIDEVSS